MGKKCPSKKNMAAKHRRIKAHLMEINCHPGAQVAVQIEDLNSTTALATVVSFPAASVRAIAR